MVLKMIVHLFFIISGGTIGFLYIPEIVRLLDFTDAAWVASPYLGMIIGAIILFVFSYFVAGHIVGFLRWIEEALIKIPVSDLLFGSFGLIGGLVIAYLVNIPLTDINIYLVSQLLLLYITILLCYFVFQVGIRRLDELMNLLNFNQKERDKKRVYEGDTPQKTLPKSKILDTSVIIDGRIADICQTNFL